MKLRLFSFLFFLSYLTVNAQYTNVINSNKPGFSESPYSVGTGIYQLESSVFYRNISIEPTFSIARSQGIDLFFRTSFFLDKLELNAQLAYQKDKVAFKNIFTSSYLTTGLSKMIIGGKYLVFEQKYEDKSKEIRSWKKRFAFDKKRLIPSVAVYVGVNLDFINNVHKTGAITPKVGVLLQNNLSPYLNIITNFYYDKIGTDYSELSYIVTATYNFTDRWSWFIENQGVSKKYLNEQNFGGGLAHLFTPNLQINTSLRYVMEGNARGYFASIGVSYRLNRHRDKVTVYDEKGNEIKQVQKTRYQSKKKGFFSRLINKVSSPFNKKKSSTKSTNTRKRKRPTRVRKESIYSKKSKKRDKKRKKKEEKKRKKQERKNKKKKDDN